MKPQGLVKQIQREIKAHPVKAGVLALVLLVAVWFWAPLVMSWMPGASAKPKTPPPVASGAPAAVANAVPAPAKAKWNPTWNEIVDWIRKDELMRPAKTLGDRRDPFRPVAPPPSTAQASEPVKVPQVDPASLGLELTGTLIGSRQNVATINGRAYVMPRSTPGMSRHAVQVVIKQQNHEFQFKLLSIEPDHVNMEFQGQPFKLKVKDKQFIDKTFELNEKSTIELHGGRSTQ